MLKKTLLTIGVFLFLSTGFYLFIFGKNTDKKILSPFTNRQLIKENKSGPLEKYDFENLKERAFVGSEIKLEKIIKEQDRYISWLFSYLSSGKKVTGMLNVPLTPESKKMPVIVMLRGYADDEIYFTGLGTRRAAEKFAQAGFVTLAPDFLGFGGSDSASADALEARFTRPMTILNLLASISSLDFVNIDHVFLWGHSNGGQIALSVLEITQANFPTTLWAPVTIGFPESILTYMNDYENLDELGKQVYDQVQDFCLNYDEKKFSIASYFDKIAGPIQIHQGGADAWVDHKETKKFVEKMKTLNKKIDYNYYLNSDHNLKQNWGEVAEKDIKFFKSFL